MKKLSITTLIAILLSFSLSVFAQSRDWQKNPTYVEITGAKRIYAVGDVHGAFDELVDTLHAMRVAKRTSPDSFRFNWTGHDSVLVFVGDLNDRGLYSKQVYDAVMDLQEKAPLAGGRVIVTLGNHEIMMLSGQVEKWAKKLTSRKKQHYQNTIDSFTRDGLDYNHAISEKGVYGRWIRNLPLFAIINGFMFVHGGIPNKPVTKSILATNFKNDIERNDWKKGLFMDHDSLIWNREWWENDELVDENLKVLGITGVVFGHTPGAMAPKGRISSKDNRLVSIDIGMTPIYSYSKGGGLIISTSASDHMVFRAVYPDAPEELLFSVKKPVIAHSTDSFCDHIKSK